MFEDYHDPPDTQPHNRAAALSHCFANGTMATLPPAAQIILALLVIHASPGRCCQFTIFDVDRLTGICPSAVVRNFARLERLNLIRWHDDGTIEVFPSAGGAA